MTTPNDMPLRPRRVSNTLLVPGVTVWEEAESGKLHKGPQLRERFDTLGCKEQHFRTMAGSVVCYDRAGFSWVTL